MSAVYDLQKDDLTIDLDHAREIAERYAANYQAAEPYNHICIDNFFPEDVLERVIDEIAELPMPESSFNRAQEKLKTSYNPDQLPVYTKALFHAFNSAAFVGFLERLTGIKGLIPDPYFIGAGIHKVANGGHLDIHADFNHHGKMDLERRLNVLIYLNRDWEEAWGGAFEIWDKKVENRIASMAPIFNRMVCFSTSSDSFHGNPVPVNNPHGDPRMSIALYYYTATWNETRKSHTTLFRPRPDSDDKKDRVVARRAFVQDALPPFIYRHVAGPLRRLGL